jgi:hypothetical protein
VYSSSKGHSSVNNFRSAVKVAISAGRDFKGLKDKLRDTSFDSSDISFGKWASWLLLAMMMTSLRS